MKNLFLIGGAMGVGKTTVSQILKKTLPNSVFLDGDWCWDAHPFQVTDETRAMVMNNITALLSNFLACSAYENVIFCWVMHQQSIIDDILARLDTGNCRVFPISLVASAEALTARIHRDVEAGLRTPDVLERSLQRLPLYQSLSTIHVDTTHNPPEAVAAEIAALPRKKETVIHSHDITLYGGNALWSVVLRPLTDEHLPLLYKWNSDPEILYYTEGGQDESLSYSPEMVKGIYGSVSKNALCFAVEVNGQTIGECWLQKMNIPEVLNMYSPQADVRRIDMMIGEKEYWGRGIGTLLVGMLMDFAFQKECVDVLHCICEDYNIRSNRVWEKNGFTLAMTVELPQPQIGKQTFHWRMTKAEYEARAQK